MIGLRTWLDDGTPMVNAQGNFIKIAGFVDLSADINARLTIAYPKWTDGLYRERIFIPMFLSAVGNGVIMEPMIDVDDKGASVSFSKRESDQYVVPSVRIYYGYISQHSKDIYG